MGKVPDVHRRRQAFRLYVRYQNLLQVSKELGIPYPTLHGWYKEEHWDQQLKDRQERLRGSVDVIKKAQDNLILQDQISELKLLEHLEVTVHNLMLNEEVRPSNWKDVIDTLKFVFQEKRLILGEPTERTVNTIEVSSMSEKDLDKEIENLHRLAGGVIPTKVEKEPTEEGE
jgi:hypothetical protein